MSSDPGGFCELYRDYLTDARQTLSHLRFACDKQDADEIRFKAHYLKSSSLILGIGQVAKICAELQDAGHASDFTWERRKLRELEKLLNLVQEELEKKLGPQVVPAAA
jgi:HPt (histidine-containing phosphotransfer) domain-containing protein